jgi:P4 family phage/plasmid primase-like protien
MKLDDFLKQYVVLENTKEKPITHTLMNNGKWHIPDDKIDKLYKKIEKYVIRENNNIQLVEKMGNIHPFILDIDIKYLNTINKREYNDQSIQQIISFLWLNLTSLLDLSDNKKLSDIWVMEKDKPYPCNSKKYNYKDGIHIVFPNILIKKTTYRKIIDFLKEPQEIEKIFNETCEISPSNMDNTLLDGCFSGWQPYGCSKENESYYKLTGVYKLNDENNHEKISDELFNDTYTNSLSIMKTLSMRGHTEENISYSSELKEIVGNQLKKTSSNSNSGMDNGNIYGGNNVYYVDHNDIINPYEIVENNEKELIKGLVKCLHLGRSSDYNKWLSVGMCLHNIDIKHFELWCEFSKNDPSYNENVCKQKWESFNSHHNGEKVGKGSLYHWAKCDNKGKYYEIMKEYLDSKIEKSISHGPDAHHLIALVISKYFEDQFICVDINDDWYYFNGVRWRKTMKANKLKKAIHDDIHKIYKEYGDKYDKIAGNLANEDGDPDEIKKYRDKFDKCLTFQKKLYQEPYVNTIIGSLKHIFYKEGIMEEFDTNNDLIGFENGIYDLKNHVFREGRPEDNLTLSTKIILPVNGSINPGEDQERFRIRSIPDSNVPLDDLNPKIEEMENFHRLQSDLQDFIKQIIPDEEVRDYTVRYISKCLSGENRDEEFNIWTGSGGNGKSKLVELIQLALGEYACNLPVALLTQKRKASGAAAPEMARTRGKRFVFMQEPDVNETLNVGEMKEITGNDKIQARGLYKEPFEFTPQFKLLLMCNQLPNIPSNDDGTWRRLRAVPFVSRFVKSEDVDIKLNRHPIDKQLKKKIPYWVIPFICLLFEEWREYDKNGIHIPEAVTDKTREYRNSNDIIGKWINECCITADNIKQGVNEYAPTEFDNLFAEFGEWCSNNEEEKPSKKIVKEAIKTWQSKSKYGLSISKKKSDNLPNGSESKPRFNLKIVE